MLPCFASAGCLMSTVGDAYIATNLPGVPTTQHATVRAAAAAAATAIGSTTSNQIIDTLASVVYNWLCLLPGKIYTNTSGTTLAGNGDNAVRIDPWIGSVRALVPTGVTAPILTTASGVTFSSGTYMVSDTATFALPAMMVVARKTDANFSNYQQTQCFRVSGIALSTVAASNQQTIQSGVAGSNNTYFDGGGDVTIATAAINGTTVSSLSDYGAFNIGAALPNVTGFNLIYDEINGSTSGSKTACIGTDSNGNSGRYWQGEIADLIWLNATPSSTEKARLTAFFKALWSIT